MIMKKTKVIDLTNKTKLIKSFDHFDSRRFPVVRLPVGSQIVAVKSSYICFFLDMI